MGSRAFGPESGGDEFVDTAPLRSTYRSVVRHRGALHSMHPPPPHVATNRSESGCRSSVPVVTAELPTVNSNDDRTGAVSPSHRPIVRTDWFVTTAARTCVRPRRSNLTASARAGVTRPSQARRTRANQIQQKQDLGRPGTNARPGMPRGHPGDQGPMSKGSLLRLGDDRVREVAAWMMRLIRGTCFLTAPVGGAGMGTAG